MEEIARYTDYRPRKNVRLVPVQRPAVCNGLTYFYVMRHDVSHVSHLHIVGVAASFSQIGSAINQIMLDLRVFPAGTEPTYGWLDLKTNYIETR